MSESDIDEQADQLFNELAKAIWSDDGDDNETVKSIRERIFAGHPPEVVERLRERLWQATIYP